MSRNLASQLADAAAKPAKRKPKRHRPSSLSIRVPARGAKPLGLCAEYRYRPSSHAALRKYQRPLNPKTGRNKTKTIYITS